jgi:hypothetical protein
MCRYLFESFAWNDLSHLQWILPHWAVNWAFYSWEDNYKQIISPWGINFLLYIETNFFFDFSRDPIDDDIGSIQK